MKPEHRLRTLRLRRRSGPDSAEIGLMVAQIGTTIVAVALVLAGLTFMWFGVERECLFRLPIWGQQIPVHVPLLLVASGIALVLLTLLVRWLLWLMRVGKLVGRRPSNSIDLPTPDVSSATLL